MPDTAYSSQTHHSPVPTRLALASIVGLWLCYFLLATFRAAVVGFEFSLPMLTRRILVTMAAMAVTALLWGLFRLFERQPLRIKGTVVAIAALPAALAIAAINQLVFADIENEVFAKVSENQGISVRRDEAGNVLVDVPDAQASDVPKTAMGRSADGTPGTVDLGDMIGDGNHWRQISDLALGRYYVLLAWIALYLALANAEQARGAERREGEYRRAAKASELRSLRYQVNPHFLFNTLNSLSALVMTGRHEAAERMIQTLSVFYRRSLAEDPTSDHALGEEIELQKLYLEIEAVRFPDRLRTRIDIPQDLTNAQLPGMILQPLVENSVKYAVAASRHPVTISVTAREDYGRLEITVADDGPGATTGVDGCGIGLSNVRDRLAARFGEQGSIVAGPVRADPLALPKPGDDQDRPAPRGYRTVIRLPLVRGRG